jgi:hypothetical protein
LSERPGFWENSIRPKLDAELLGLWRFLNAPFPDGPNEYIAALRRTCSESEAVVAILNLRILAEMPMARMIASS